MDLVFTAGSSNGAVQCIDVRGGSRVFVEEGFDLHLSGLCVQLSQPA